MSFCSSKQLLNSFHESQLVTCTSAIHFFSARSWCHSLTWTQSKFFVFIDWKPKNISLKFGISLTFTQTEWQTPYSSNWWKLFLEMTQQDWQNANKKQRANGFMINIGNSGRKTDVCQMGFLNFGWSSYTKQCRLCKPIHIMHLWYGGFNKSSACTLISAGQGDSVAARKYSKLSSLWSRWTMRGKLSAHLVHFTVRLLN